MIRLDTTTRKLQALLGGSITTNQLPVTVCYSDKTSTAYTGGTTVINTNNTTAVDICAAPAASTVRDVDTINVNNADTVAATITIRYNDNGTTYTLFKAQLETGDQLTYVHGDGWKVLDSAGVVKSFSPTDLKLSSFAPTTSAELATVITDETGSGLLVFGTSPTLTTPVLSGTVTGTYLLSGTPTINLSSGAVGSPSLYLNGETTSGLYRIGANNHGWAISGAKVLDIASTGLGVTGDFSATGNATLGDASTDTVTVNGYVGHGVAPSGDYGYRMSFTGATAASQYGFFIDAFSNSAGTSNTVAVRAKARTSASAYTTGTMVGVLADTNAQGAGSTITNNYGFFAADQTIGSTLNVGFRSSVTSGTGKWGFYAAGTADNAFAGNVRIGSTTAPTVALDVTGVVQTSGNVYINDTSNANMTLGLTINQGANDNEILSLKSSDVAHGMTSVTETDTYGYISKFSATDGGAFFDGLADTGATGLRLRGVMVTANTTKTTSGLAAVMIDSALKSTTTVASSGADANMVAFRDNGTTRFILDADGDSHQDVGTSWTNFHGHDDHHMLSLLSAHVSRKDDPIRERFFGDFLKERRDVLERVGLATFNDDGHHFVNMSKLAMLNTGAILQAGDRIRTVEDRIEHLAAENARLSATLQRLEYNHANPNH